jgi:hypothetical protein
MIDLIETISDCRWRADAVSNAGDMVAAVRMIERTAPVNRET